MNAAARPDAGVTELVDVADLKSAAHRACRFEPDRPHRDAPSMSMGSRALSTDGMSDRVLMRAW